MCENLIKAKIESTGAITFKDFMQLALYSEQGYYQRDSIKIGAEGDFITAPEISPLFGQCLANQIHQIIESLEQAITIVEIGPGKGTLAKDIIDYLQKFDIEIEAYYLIETSPSLQQVQKATLNEHSFCKWASAIDQIPSFTGIILANELFDALPVHKVQLNNKHQEWYVSLDDKQKLSLRLGPISCVMLEEMIDTTLQSLPFQLPYPYDTEFNLNQTAMIEACNHKLQQGVLLFIDYGFGEREYYNPSRHMGTIMTHHQHHSTTDPLASPGLQDITSHVDFTALTRCSTELGLGLLGFAPQSHFLMQLDILNLQPHSYQQSQAIQTLVGPHEMGELFKVIAFAKNFNHDLKGFSPRDFSRFL